jgi:crotonobetainyl-CoA:carnitine CoA-transferase CaiB-like acyl-CoA transferase
MPHSPASSALDQYTVLDLTRVRSGPTCIRQLADWGANVIKVEMPESMTGGEQMGGARHGSDFQNLHRNKRSLSLNLKDPEGLKIFQQLAQTADVIVENFRPDVKHRLGIDYESLSVENPGLIYASISGFGQDGPYAGRPGFDQIAQGMGGLMSITGQPGQGPMRVGIPVADLTAGIFAAQGILVALLEREKSGKGQWLHTSLLEAQIFMLDFQNARWLVDGHTPQQAGNNHPTSIPTGVFKTANGEINISVTGRPIWQRFCSILGLDDLVDHPDFNTEEKRSANRDDLNSRITDVTKSARTEHWVSALNEAGVPCGPINSIDQTFADPQVQHLGVTESIQSAKLGDLEMVSQPVSLERTPSHLVTAPPECGEHNQEVLADLGYSAEQISDLRIRQVI